MKQFMLQSLEQAPLIYVQSSIQHLDHFELLVNPYPKFPDVIQ